MVGTLVGFVVVQIVDQIVVSGTVQGFDNDPTFQYLALQVIWNPDCWSSDFVAQIVVSGTVDDFDLPMIDPVAGVVVWIVDLVVMVLKWLKVAAVLETFGIGLLELVLAEVVLTFSIFDASFHK